MVTAIGQSMKFGAGELAKHANRWLQTPDLSGDRQSNQASDPRTVPNGLPIAITINALVTGSDGRKVQGVIRRYRR